ncbi:uncharacterized protein LOC132205400 [Neocloeon triangulifer]|uniref:uncharacterized protein LOC132205400 n=1 Tax=Neocloeon triangulifer TaxID=2078957 RepID=UPI00286F2E2C|nr:uncharacterized protein LOC132205400 [Neocloeon triangulifer]
MRRLVFLVLVVAASVGASDYLPVSDEDYFYEWERAGSPAAGYLPYYRRNDLDLSVHMGRTRVGQGFFRVLSGGRDAELRCDFPTNDLISNIVWERVTDPTGRSYTYHPLYFGDLSQREFYYDGTAASPNYYARSTVLQRPEGASLYLRDISPSDAGVYRCMASRRVPHSIGKWASAVETVFQDVFFYPSGDIYSK